MGPSLASRLGRWRPLPRTALGLGELLRGHAGGAFVRELFPRRASLPGGLRADRSTGSGVRTGIGPHGALSGPRSDDRCHCHPRGEGRGVAAQTSRAGELESVPPSTAREGVVDETRRSVTPPVASILAACPPPVGRDSCAPLADPTTPDRSLSSWRTSASRRTRACSRCSPGCSRTPPSTTRSPTTYGATLAVLEGGTGGVTDRSCTSSCSTQGIVLRMHMHLHR